MVVHSGTLGKKAFVVNGGSQKWFPLFEGERHRNRHKNLLSELKRWLSGGI